MFTWFKRSRDRCDGDDPDISIIDALRYRVPPPVRDVKIVNPAHASRPDPPSRETRRELHITGPQRARPYVNGMPRPPAGRVLLAARKTLPVFHAVAHQLGWRGLIPPPRPTVTAAAMRSIEAYTDKTVRVICQRTEQARAELWERARDYDLRETELRLRRPLTNQRGMLHVQQPQ